MHQTRLRRCGCCHQLSFERREASFAFVEHNFSSRFYWRISNQAHGSTDTRRELKPRGYWDDPFNQRLWLEEVAHQLGIQKVTHNVRISA